MIGEKVYLRALEPEDLSILYEWENDAEVWTISHTAAPYSKCVLERLIETSALDIYTNKQLRLMMNEKTTHQTVGIIDFFDFDPMHQRAGVGILIAKDARGKGYGYEGIILAKKYLFDVLNLHQIYCNIMADNAASIRLFQKAGFSEMGRKKEWIWTKNGFVDEFMFQCINNL